MRGAFGDLSNHHPTKHVKTKKWYELYKKRNDDGSESNLIGISETKLLLIKFFVTSNLALKQLENVYLRKCLKDEIKMPCIKTFKFTYLVEVFNKMKCLISEKCKEATYITLVPDGWSDDLNTHYLGKHPISSFWSSLRNLTIKSLLSFLRHYIAIQFAFHNPLSPLASKTMPKNDE